MSQLSRADVSVSVLIEDLEGLLDLLLAVGVLHLASHHGKELGKVDGAVAVGVDLVDHVLEFCLCGVLSQRAHHGAELLSGDGAITVCIEAK